MVEASPVLRIPVEAGDLKVELSAAPRDQQREDLAEVLAHLLASLVKSNTEDERIVKVHSHRLFHTKQYRLATRFGTRVISLKSHRSN